MKIKCELDAFETEALFDILHHEIVKYKIESKFSFLNKEISESRLLWEQCHARFLERIAKKLSGGKYSPVESKPLSRSVINKIEKSRKKL